MTDDSNAGSGHVSEEFLSTAGAEGSSTPLGVGSLVASGSTPMPPLEAEGRVLTARGTEDGLVLRIDGGAEWSDILTDLENFLGGRKKFFAGGEVAIEWLERLPGKEQCGELEVLLKEQYGLTITPRRKRPMRVPNLAVESGAKAEHGKAESKSREPNKGTSEVKDIESGRTISLFEKDLDARFAADNIVIEDRSASKASARRSKGEPERSGGILEEIEMLASGSGLGSSGMGSSGSGSSGLGGKEEYGSARRQYGQVKKVLGEDLFYEDDANAKVVYGTIRSGQRLETPFSLIVVGDVNPGADLVAGGDIIVLGSLRGTAHAAAYDDDAFDRVIIALQMQPMQLRIGSIISRGSDDKVRGAEIARIENRKIVVEAFNARGIANRKW